MEARLSTFNFDFSARSESAKDTSKAVELVQRECARDVKEKNEFNQLNDRFSYFLTNIEELKSFNEQLQSDLKDEFTKWGIFPRDEQHLQQILNKIKDRTIERSSDEVHSRTAEQTSAIYHRTTTVFGHIYDTYQRKKDNLNGTIDQLEIEFIRVTEQERLSEDELLLSRSDLNQEMKKFSGRLQDWLHLMIEKQILLDDIQSLRERRNFILALNEEEINEWKRLLEQSQDDSMKFYREELTNAIRDIKRDYSRQAKKFQDEIEYQIEEQIILVENQLKQMFDFNEQTDESMKNNRFEFNETKLITNLEEFDYEQNRFNELTRIVADKRRTLRDEEIRLNEMQRKIREQQEKERLGAEKLQHEYHDLRRYLQQIAFQLRFSVEDELKIYECLLNELTNQSNSSGQTLPSSYLRTNISHYPIESMFIRSNFDDIDSSSFMFSSRNADDTQSGRFNIFNQWPTTSTFTEIRGNEIHETFDSNTTFQSFSLSKID